MTTPDDDESQIERDVEAATEDVDEATTSAVQITTDFMVGMLQSPDVTEVIPRNVIVNTAAIIFGNFTASLIYYNILANIFVFYDQFLDYDYAQTHEANLIMSGAACLFLPFTGWFSDVYKNYLSAMHLYGAICFTGVFILPVVTFDWSIFGASVVIPLQTRRALVYVARILVTLGISGVNCTAPPFAALQIERYGIAEIQACFHAIYTIVQFAPLIDYTALTFVQLNVSFFASFALLLATNVAAIVIFRYYKLDYKFNDTTDAAKAYKTVRLVAASSVKHKLTPTRTESASCCPRLSSSCSCCSTVAPCCTPCTCSASCPSWCQRLFGSIETSEVSETVELVSKGALTSTFGTAGTETTSPNASESTMTPTTTAADGVCPSAPPSNPNTAAPTPFSNQLVTHIVTTTCISTDEVTRILWLLCAIGLLSCVLPYNMIRYQIATSYAAQAERMKPVVFGTTISSSALQNILPLAGVIIAPLFNKYLYPYMSNRLVVMGQTTRALWGLGFATISVFAAALVETARLNLIDRGDSFTIETDNLTLLVADLPFSAIIPQYIFLAIADVLVFITGLEFAFNESPTSLRATVTALFFLFSTLGEIIAILMVPLINTITAGNEWYPHEINDGHLNYYFMVLTAISFINCVSVWCMSKGYQSYMEYATDKSGVRSSVDDSAATTATQATPATPATPAPNTASPASVPATAATTSIQT